MTSSDKTKTTSKNHHHPSRFTVHVMKGSWLADYLIVHVHNICAQNPFSFHLSLTSTLHWIELTWLATCTAHAHIHSACKTLYSKFNNLTWNMKVISHRTEASAPPLFTHFFSYKNSLLPSSSAPSFSHKHKQDWIKMHNRGTKTKNHGKGPNSQLQKWDKKYVI